MARFRKIDSRIHNDEKFRRLDHLGKLVFFTILTHPGMTCLGAMRATVAGLAAELKMDPDAMSDAIGHGCREGMLVADWEACFLWAPNFLRYNEPSGPNCVAKGWLSALDLIPECDGKRALIRKSMEYLNSRSEAFKKAIPAQFWDAMRHAIPDAIPDAKSQPCPIQEQEQEQEYIPPLPPEGDGGDRQRKRTTNGQEPPGFAKFWKTYPRPRKAPDRKCGRPQCLAKWRSGNLEDHAPEIIAAVEQLKRSAGWTKEGGQFIPGPLPFLNQRKWEEVLAETPPAQPARVPGGVQVFGEV